MEMDVPPSPEARQMASKATPIRLREAKWYAFDLDDTLHSFRKASAAAVKSVLEVVHDKSGVALEDLDAGYKRILNEGTALAFVDGKTSHQYREDRFWQLARAFDIRLSDIQLQALVNLYEEVLINTLELKPGVLELLETLKRYGHKIAVITEGPQDAQERTIEALGIAPYINYLGTTNELRVAKIDGLFVKVLEQLNLQAKDMIMIGDSWERDILPAIQAGIYCIHYSGIELNNPETDGMRRINNFKELQTFIEKAHTQPET